MGTKLAKCNCLWNSNSVENGLPRLGNVCTLRPLHLVSPISSESDTIRPLHLVSGKDKEDAAPILRESDIAQCDTSAGSTPSHASNDSGTVGSEKNEPAKSSDKQCGRGSRNRLLMSVGVGATR